MILALILIAIIVFIVLSTAKYKLHPFLVLIIASFIAAFSYGLPSEQIVKTITGGFGGILGYIGLVITIGTIIGVILEKKWRCY
jgi:GntP family gluconate:H+ symporter